MPIFRRIHGHIVPIKLSEEQKAGVGMVGAGVGTAAAAGYLSAGLERDAAGYHNVGRDMKKKWMTTMRSSRVLDAQAKGIAASSMRRSAGQVKHMAVKNLVEAKRSSFAAGKIKTIGQTTGAVLVGAGVHRLLPQKIKDDPKLDAAVSVGAGLSVNKLISTLLVRAGNYSAHGVKPLHALRLAAKRVAARGFKL